MSEGDELRERLETLESQVARLREDAATARVLASMADRDVAEMRTTARGHTQVLNAIRETQIEQDRALQAHDRTLQTIAEAVGGLAVGQSQLATGQDQLTERIGGLEQGQTAILQQLQQLTDRLTPPANEQ